MHGLFTVKVKSSFLDPRCEMEEPSVKYILLRDRVGHTVGKSLLSLGLRTKSAPLQVLRGEILEGVPAAEQPTDLTKVAVVGIERKSLRLECRTDDMTRLSEEEANLLLAISSSERRYQTFIDRKRLAFGGRLLPGSAVFAEVKGISKVLPGVVWYKGELPSSLGTWFGVELIKNPGSGTCNGTFRNKKLFTCAPDSGVFVGLDKLTPREDEEDLKSQKVAKKDENTQTSLKTRLKDSIWSFWKGTHKQRSFEEIKGVLKIDERVVTFMNDNPARGTVRYIGEEKDSTGNVYIIVGLELDERIGAGCGKRLGHLLFICMPGHAAFVPVESVIPEKDFDENPEKPEKQEARGKWGQIHEDEMCARSMNYVKPSGTSKEYVKKLRRTNSMTSAETELVVAAGESSKTDPQEFIERQRQILRESEGKNIQDNQDNDVIMQDEERTDSAENFPFKGGNGIMSVDNHYGLEVGSMVEVPVADGVARCGVIRWIGSIPQVKGKLVAGLELELEESACSDGTFHKDRYHKDRYFTCPAGRGFFVLLENCRPDSRFANSATTDVGLNAERDFASMPSPEVKGITEPPKTLEEKYCGLMHGLQGHHDSCYLDATLFNNNGSGSVDSPYGLKVGSGVEVPKANGVPRYGVIRWIGNLPQVKDKLVAGLELEEEEPAGSDGTFYKERYFTCPPGKGFLVLLENCQPDSRLDQRPTEEKEQEGNVHRLVRELEEQVTHLQAELREKELSENNLQEQLREKEQREENLRKQLHEMEQQLTDLRGQLQERSEQLRYVTQQMTIVRGQLQEKDEKTANLQNQATALRQQLEQKDQEMTELETTLSTAQDELRDYQRQQSPEWVISRDRIQLTDKFLGKGGWGSVVEGKYCGCTVAVKQIHELILSPHNLKLFEREMDIASRCRHPCLLQFIGATNDEGNPLFVTELMETSLRTLLEQRALFEVEISLISLDVARALNYLHQKQPSPIIHRDISSANVLLWRQGEHWRGKVSDYGTANFIQQTMTVAPGAMIYSAPEAYTKNQTVKVDVYSFGVLLCEMCIREMPDPQKRVRQVTMVKNKLSRTLIRRCLESEPVARPSIQEIIDELEEPN